MAKNKGGRPPKSTALHIIEGTYNPTKHGGRNDIMQGLTFVGSHDLPQPTIELGQSGQAEWNRVISQAGQVGGWIAVTDLAALESHCQNVDTLMSARRELKKHGRVITNDKGTPIVSPYWRVYMDCIKEYRYSCSQFGLTPSDRTGIKLENKASKELDEFEDVL